MKNIFKISAVLFIGFSLVFSSCKKEIDGCTDSSAMNYSSDANSDDGSCISAYDIAQGQWDIETACEELIISIPLVGDFPFALNDIFPDIVDITGEGEGVVAMDINGNIVLADVANDGEVTIQEGQKISFDTSSFDPTGLIGEVDVDITGSGTIVSDSNGNLSLTLSFEILGTPQSSTCEITFSK